MQIEEMIKKKRIKEIFEYLNDACVRCTYGAVGEAIGGDHPLSVAQRYLGERRPEASWVVNARTGQTTGYSPAQKHPQLEEKDHIIRSGDKLVKCMCEQRGVGKT